MARAHEHTKEPQVTMGAAAPLTMDTKGCDEGSAAAVRFVARLSGVFFVTFVRSAKLLRGFGFFVNVVTRRSRLVVPSWVKRKRADREVRPLS